MLSRTITAAVALAAAVAVSAAVHRYRAVHRVLARERVTNRLMDGCLYRDMEVLHVRLGAAMARQEAERAVLLEAGRAVDEALAVHGSRLRDLNDPFDPYQEGDAA
jgi:hypothetical protein